MPNLQPGTYKIGSTAFEGRPKYARFYYEFSQDGGAVSSITMRGDAIPSGALVTDAVLHVDTIPTSAGAATVALTLESAADVQAAAAYNGAPYSTTGPKRASALTATATPLKTTAARSLVAVVAAAALTAGKFSVVLTYIELA